MGTMEQAVCSGCGYTSRMLYLGGGMFYFTVRNTVPALCRHCKEIVGVNYLAKRHRCPRCGRKPAFFDDLLPEDDDETKWQEPGLGVEYECPKCGEKRMVFEIRGHYDKKYHLGRITACPFKNGGSYSITGWYVLTI